MTVDGEVLQKYDYFLPKKNRITKVTIYYKDFILGFRFHLSDGSDWCIGVVRDWFDTEEIYIAENEVIVGFKATSHPRCLAQYVEWQFITARQLRFD